MKKRIKQLALLCLAALSLVFGACAAEAAATPLPAPQNLRMEGKILVWDAVEHAAGYVVRLQNREQEVEGTSFDLSSLAVGTYAVRVKAYGDGGKYTNSDWSRFSYTAEEAVARGYDELGYQYTLLEDGTGYSIHRGKVNTFKMEKIVIPAYYRGLPVKRIAEGGFAMYKPTAYIAPNPYTRYLLNEVTEEIVLPATLEEIGPWGLAGMSKLESVVIPDSVTKLEKRAFYGCINLKTVKLPAGLKEIPERCFEACGLAEITLPDGLETIGNRAFCARGVRFYPEKHDVYIDQSFTDVVIPASVKTIEASAFYGCQKLKNITLKGVPEELGVMVFDDTAWYHARPNGPVYLGDILMEYNGTMPEDYTLYIPATVKGIAGIAFRSQKNLKSVIIPDGVSFIGNSIFANCSSLSEIRLPSDLARIPDRTFSGCISLSQIEIPATVTEIGEETFSGCISLSQIEIPATVTEIGDYAFSSTAVTKIVLPAGLKSIGSYAFYHCESLEQIVLPVGLKSIERNAFTACKKLREIVLPEQLESIGLGAFGRCESLEEIVLPSGLKSIGRNAFQNCKKLREIVIPASVEDLGWFLLSNCDALEAVYFEGDERRLEIVLEQAEETENNTHFSGATVYFYAETLPAKAGNYWHYADGVPAVWGAES